VSSSQRLLSYDVGVVARRRRWRGSGGDLLVEAEVRFDRGDADFKLEAFVDFALLELGQLGVETIYLRRKVGLDAVDLGVELVDAAIKACFGSGQVFLGRHVLDDMGEHVGDLFEAGFLWCHMRGVYHADPLGHECTDGFDITQHENRKKRARIVEMRIMRIGCVAAHGFREGRGRRDAGLSSGFGCGSRTRQVAVSGLPAMRG
jgi:hypothetical protein